MQPTSSRCAQPLIDLEGPQNCALIAALHADPRLQPPYLTWGPMHAGVRATLSLAARELSSAEVLCHEYDSMPCNGIQC